MDKNITLQNLIAFAYNETEILETVQVVEAIESNLEISEEYEAILATKKLLDDTTFEPSQKVLNKILLYSKRKNFTSSVSK